VIKLVRRSEEHVNIIRCRLRVNRKRHTLLLQSCSSNLKGV